MDHQRSHISLKLSQIRKIMNVSCAGSSDVRDDVVYDTSVVGNSVVTSYGLTCNSHYLTQVNCINAKTLFW